MKEQFVANQFKELVEYEMDELWKKDLAEMEYSLQDKVTTFFKSAFEQCVLSILRKKLNREPNEDDAKKVVLIYPTSMDYFCDLVYDGEPLGRFKYGAGVLDTTYCLIFYPTTKSPD